MNSLADVPTDPTTDKKTKTREQILQAALTCFAQKGYHRTTMDDIVAQSDLSKGSLYWHFKSKQELFISLMEWFMLEFGQAAFHDSLSDMSATGKIRSMMQVLIENNEQFIPFFKITLDFWAQTTEDEQLQRLFNKILDQFQGQLSAIIEEGITSGEFRSVDSAQAALALFAIADALVLYATLLGDRIDIRGTLATTLDIFLAGLKQ